MFSFLVSFFATFERVCNIFLIKFFGDIFCFFFNVFLFIVGLGMDECCGLFICVNGFVVRFVN